MTIDQLRKTIGQRVKEFRKARGMSQEDLAGAVERSVQSISKLERGLSLPGLKLLFALSQALDVPVAELLRAEPGDDPRGVLLARIRGVAEGLDDAGLETAARLLDALRRG